PLVVVTHAPGTPPVIGQEAAFFSKAALVTFGGAYAVLAYINQAAVQQYGWLLPGQMVTGLGLAESTPGPLIMVTEFVGFLGAYRRRRGLRRAGPLSGERPLGRRGRRCGRRDPRAGWITYAPAHSDGRR